MVSMHCISGFRVSGGAAIKSHIPVICNLVLTKIESFHWCLTKVHAMFRWLVAFVENAFDHKGWHLQMRGTSPGYWSDSAGAALSWLMWALCLIPEDPKCSTACAFNAFSCFSPGEPLNDVSTPVVTFSSCPSPRSDSEWAWIASSDSAAYKSPRSDRNSWNSFARDVPYLHKSASGEYFMFGVQRHFQCVYWGLHTTAFTARKPLVTQCTFETLPICSTREPTSYAASGHSRAFYLAHCIDCGSSPLMRWSGWLTEPRQQQIRCSQVHSVVPVVPCVEIRIRVLCRQSIYHIRRYLQRLSHDTKDRFIVEKSSLTYENRHMMPTLLFCLHLFC